MTSPERNLLRGRVSCALPGCSTSTMCRSAPSAAASVTAVRQDARSSQLFAQVSLKHADARADAGAGYHSRLQSVVRGGVASEQRRGGQRSPAHLRVGSLLRKGQRLQQAIKLPDVVEAACRGACVRPVLCSKQQHASTPSAWPNAITSLAMPASAMQQKTSSEAELILPPATSLWNALSANCVPACTFNAPSRCSASQADSV